MQEIVKTMMIRPITTVGKYIMLMGRTFARPERMRMFFKQYLNEMVQLGVNSIGIVLLISFFIGAVITIQIKLNIESPWMPRFVVGYTTREIMLLEFSSSIMCLILAGKVGSNIASEIGTMRVTQQIDALEIMGVNSAGYLILPKIVALMTMIPFLVIFSIFSGIIGAFCTCWFGGVIIHTHRRRCRYNCRTLARRSEGTVFAERGSSRIPAFKGDTPGHRRRHADPQST